ncbi:hypothetical protein [Williamsia phyllosphaerae]|uniref:TY-Chap C-terminal domain-containing protein n=1 Tax=Williamsia phyllosphaerae TaxID=885042 RepID=A0ABQ1UYV1_9NOCA|nr:hypothetical protein [Williamsia phyllosphaerae]GGF28878.1 hypothetical protein GCM10007298_25910 [Williamsia phyllosphaerae]
MSLPLTDLEFDDEIDRAWSRFHGSLVARLSGIADDEVVSFRRERADADSAPDLTVRRLHAGVLCAVLAVDADADQTAVAGWSRTGEHHLTGLASSTTPGDLVDDVIVVARTVWGITHPSFLRAVRSVPPIAPGSRAAAMADHPAGGIGRTVRRVVHERLAGSVEVDHYQALELRYPKALVQLQLWEVERSALLWTTIRGVVDPIRLEAAQAVVERWPGLELVSEGTIVDVELAVDLGDRPTRSMITALDRWHDFMRDGYRMVVEALVRPGDDTPTDVRPALCAVIRRHRDDRRVGSDELDGLVGLGRAELLDSLDLCRRQSISWMSWADRRRAADDADGSATACREAQVWDATYATVAAALRMSVSPND